VHYRMFVTFDKGNAKTSKEARDYAYDTLLNDSGFSSEGSRFGSPVCDWFVIGGRWSGLLSTVSWGKKLYKQIRKMEKEADIQIRGCHYGSEEKRGEQTTLKEKVETLYEEALPKRYKGLLTYDRSSYAQYGYEDDAMVLTKELYEACLKDHEGEDCDGEHYVDLDFDCVGPEMVGKKWLVVVDYHN